MDIIRSNLFDYVGRYCQLVLAISVLEICSQRLSHQRSVKRRQALLPLVTMTKSDTVNMHLEELVVMEGEELMTITGRH